MPSYDQTIARLALILRRNAESRAKKMSMFDPRDREALNFCQSLIEVANYAILHLPPDEISAAKKYIQEIEAGFALANSHPKQSKHPPALSQDQESDHVWSGGLIADGNGELPFGTLIIVEQIRSSNQIQSYVNCRMNATEFRLWQIELATGVSWS